MQFLSGLKSAIGVGLVVLPPFVVFVQAVSWLFIESFDFGCMKYLYITYYIILGQCWYGTASMNFYAIASATGIPIY